MIPFKIINSLGQSDAVKEIATDYVKKKYKSIEMEIINKKALVVIDYKLRRSSDFVCRLESEDIDLIRKFNQL